MDKCICIILILFTSITYSVYAHKTPPAQVVISHVFEKKIAQTAPFVGIIDFNKIADATPEISGLIEAIYFDEGSIISENNPLVNLNVDLINKDIEIIQKQIEQVEVKIQSAGKNLARLEQLYKTSVSSEQEYDNYFYLNKELIKQKEQLEKSKERLNLSIQKSIVKAPFTGIILKKFHDEGEWVTPNTPICRIASINDTIVKVAISENLEKFLFKGQKLLVKIKAEQKQFDGELLGFIPVEDTISKTFFVKIKIPYFKRAIQNMSAIVHIPISVKQKMQMIKRDALIKFNGKDFIYTIADNKALIIPIKILVYDGEYIGISNPLIKVGMPVVIDGNDRLKPGQAVIVKGEH